MAVALTGMAARLRFGLSLDFKFPPQEIAARPSSGCRHLLPARGEKGYAAPAPLNLDAAFGTSPRPVYGERVRVRGNRQPPTLAQFAANGMPSSFSGNSGTGTFIHLS
ncbi:hypothetical protein GGI64_005306 [Rhizobium leguminosarum]|uniref:Uncharacterized protein n=1 Tax=Rhizobium leguminosarum TaxID=384 RepID=A0A7Z0E3D8_RHILE|nr:hypothetical protein [Rhizobium leguminosarum]